MPSSETSPLLAHGGNGQSNDVEQSQASCDADPKKRAIVWSVLTALFAGALVLILGFKDTFANTFGPWVGLLPRG